MSHPFAGALIETVARALALSLLESAVLVGCVAVLMHLRPVARAATRELVWSLALVTAAGFPAVSLLGSVAQIRHVATTASARVEPANDRLSAVAAGRIHEAAVRNGTTALAVGVAGHAARPAAAVRRTIGSSAVMIFGCVLLVAGRTIGGSAVAILGSVLLVAVVVSLARAGGLLFAVAALARVKRAARPLRARDDSPVARALAAPARRTIRLAVSDEIDVPVAVGFRRPAILIPAPIARAATERDLARIVLHERAHLDRFDDVGNVLQLLIVRAFWFNPAIAYAAGRLALERELAADEWVVARTGEPREYASCLVRLLDLVRGTPQPGPAPGALFTRRDLAIRVERLLSDPATPAPRSLGVVAVAALVAAAALGLQLRFAPALAVVDQRTTLARPAARTPAPLLAPVAAVGAAATLSPVAPVPPVPQRAKPRRAASPAAPQGLAAAPSPAALQRLAAGPSPAPSPALAPTPESPASALGRHLTEARSLSRALVRATQAPSGFAGPRATPRAVGTLAPAIGTELDAAARVLERMRPELDALAADRAAMAVQRARDAVPADVDARLRAAERTLEAAGPQLEANARRAMAAAASTTETRAGARAQSGATRAFERAQADATRSNARAQAAASRAFARAQSDATRTSARAEADAMRAATLAGSRPPDLQRGGTCLGCDLHGADLRGRDLRGVDLKGSDLSSADLRNANLAGATLDGVDLSSARLEGADLRGATLHGVDLSAARLHDSRREGVTFDGEPLRESDLTDAGASL